MFRIHLHETFPSLRIALVSNLKRKSEKIKERESIAENLYRKNSNGALLSSLNFYSIRACHKKVA